MLTTRRRVKIKARWADVGSVLSWSLDHRTREFVMCWLRVYAWLRLKIRKRNWVAFMLGNVRRVRLRQPSNYAIEQHDFNTFRDHTLKLVATRSHSLWPEKLYSSKLVTRSRFLVFVSSQCQLTYSVIANLL